MIFHDIPLELGVAIQGSWGHHFPGSSHPRFLQLMSFREGFKELKRPTKFAEIRSNKRVSTSRCLPGLKYQQIPGTGRSKRPLCFPHLNLCLRSKKNGTLGLGKMQNQKVSWITALEPRDLKSLNHKLRACSDHPLKSKF